MKFVFVLSTTLLTLLLNVTVGNRQYKALKFGNTKSDYIYHRPDMGPLQYAFSVCSWVRSLKTSGAPSWLSYAVSDSSDEIIISDNGGYDYMFTSYGLSLRSYYSRLSGRGIWFHYCMTWSYSSRMRRVYLNGREIGAISTASSRSLRTGGYLYLGNDQDSYPGGGFTDNEAFGGELYKLNFFSKELSSSEVQAMAENKCSEIELTYGDVRSIKWEDILQGSRNGNVRDIDSGCNASRMWATLSETMEKLRNSSQELNKTRAELGRVKEETMEKLRNSSQELNKTRAELGRVKEEKAAKDTELVTTERLLNATIEELNRTREEKKTSETNLDTKGRLLNETIEELNMTKTGKEACETGLDTKEQHLNESLVELKSIKNDLATSEGNLNTTRAELDTKGRQLNETIEYLNTTRAEKEEALEELERKTEDLTRITTSLNETQIQLDQVRKQLEKVNNTPPDCPLNSTITSYWDLLYSEDYFGAVISTEKLDVLYKSVEKLEYFVGLRVTEGMIRFMKHFHDGPDRCPNSTD